MRAFIVFCCMATAYAASLGYDYERQSAGVTTGGEQSYQSASPVGSYDDNDYSSHVEYTKEFFSYSAPEAAFDDHDANQQLANSAKRGLRVIFIKGPENSALENAALQLAKSAGEQRTAIYVLNKQANIGDLANKLSTLNEKNANKPEVHFVKYRTPADAENAQRAIQYQYDSLGGRSSSHNGGVAPVLDFASKVPASSGHQSAALVGSYLPPNKRV